MYRLILILITILIAGCASQRLSTAPEPLGNWTKRTECTWQAMKDGGKNPSSLDDVYVQNGMSTPDSLTVLIYPERGTYSDKWVGNLLPADVTVQVEPKSTHSDVQCSKVGTVFRCTVKGLFPGTEYTVTILDGEKQHKVLAKTAPATDGDQPDTSILLVSCNEPWIRVGKECPMIREGEKFPQVAISSANALRLLELRATGNMPVKIGGQEQWSRPDFMLGLGDQAYVDAVPGNNSSLAIFGGDRSDQMLLDVKDAGQWEGILDRIYRMHFFIPPLHRTLQSLPSAMVWDDHEIRDGWGSQGDEDGYIRRWDEKSNKVVTSELAWLGYYGAARNKAREFEFARNPGLAERNAVEFDTQFEWGPRLKVFLMDTRSQRRSSGQAGQQPMFSPEQGARVETWLSECGRRPSVFLLGLPVPISLSRENMQSSLFQSVRDEAIDDMRDEWWWPGHAEQREYILRLIRTHARKCLQDRVVVVSGDVHESGLYAILDSTDRIAAYEVVSSGIATLTESFAGQATVFGTYTKNGIRQVGRIAKGASFAELLMKFPEDNPPEVTTLFYATTGARDWDQALRNNLVNAAPELAGKPWELTERTRTSSLWENHCVNFPDTDKVALQLDYGVEAGKSMNYGLSSRVVRCETQINVYKNYATDWQFLTTDWAAGHRVCLPENKKGGVLEKNEKKK